jgi:hypothetical protein
MAARMETSASPAGTSGRSRRRSRGSFETTKVVTMRFGSLLRFGGIANRKWFSCGLSSFATTRRARRAARRNFGSRLGTVSSHVLSTRLRRAARRSDVCSRFHDDVIRTPRLPLATGRRAWVHARRDCAPAVAASRLGRHGG